jgi:Tol biopolymer transport system component
MESNPMRGFSPSPAPGRPSAQRGTGATAARALLALLCATLLAPSSWGVGRPAAASAPPPVPTDACPHDRHDDGQSGRGQPGAKADSAAAKKDAKTDEKKDEQKWDVNETHGPSQTLSFSTDEGTWMSTDVSPDGKTVVFDLLGDLYTVPISGGDAQRLTSGRAWDYQPRFSPDGKKLLFTSDRGGTDNLWLAKADGTEPEKFTEEKDKVTNCGAWSADGDYIVAKRRLTDQSSIGTTELWIYHRTGGTGLQLTKKDDIPEVSEPVFHPDGRHIFFSARPSRFNYDRDVNDGIYQIRRYDRQTAQVSPVTSRFGGAGRPAISRDGHWLAFVSRQGQTTILIVHDLQTGAERVVTDGLAADLMESFAWAGVYPGIAWTPDGREIVLTMQGKLWRVSVADGHRTPIPFRAQV